MIMRDFVKKILGLKEIEEIVEERWQDNVSGLKGQLEVDEAEITYLKTKLFKIRQILGEDDKTFSDFTRTQIKNMSLREFRGEQDQIDRDVANGKLFLQ